MSEPTGGNPIASDQTLQMQGSDDRYEEDQMSRQISYTHIYRSLLPVEFKFAYANGLTVLHTGFPQGIIHAQVSIKRWNRRMDSSISQ